MSTIGLGLWQKIYIISWKNCIILRHRWKQLFTQIVTPSIFLLILIVLRFLVQVEHMDSTIEPHTDLVEKWQWVVDKVKTNQEKINKHGISMHNCFLPKLIVAYAPNTTLYNEMMASASKNYLSNIEIKAFENVWSLRWSMRKDHFLAGVIFNHSEHYTEETTSDDKNNEKVYDLDYSLVFPSEFRFHKGSFITFHWNTNTDFLAYRDSHYFDHLREGFISLQYAISMTFIKDVLKENLYKTIKMNHFPRLEYVRDPLMKKFQYSLPLIILVGYLGPCTQFAKRIIREKEHHLRGILKVHGITQSIHFLTWFIRGFVLSLFGSLFVLLILKINWSDGFGICTNSSWTALYFFIICYNVACTCYCYMMASMTNKSSLGVALLGVTWFLTFMPYLASQTQSSPGTGTKLAITLFSNSLMGLAFTEIIEFENRRMGLQWNKFFSSESKREFISIGEISVILLAFSIIYSILGIFMNDIFVFFRTWFRFILQKRQHGSESRTRLSLRKSKIFQIEKANRTLSVEVKDLTKVYGEEVVVANVSLPVYQGEITVIMGHNASGKTVLLSMLAGVIKPTRGTVLYQEVDIFKSANYGLDIGISLQNNLFQDLTAFNMIVFYCRLKGLTGPDVTEEAHKYLRAMNLTSLAKVLVRNLTGGQKRHLRVCCALCGYSKYVVLDEPSAGLDTITQRKFWALLMKEKINRSIILTTQSTEEAEVLGDRLAILSKGELMCYGSPYFLKAIYGKGYRLVCLKGPNCNTDDVNNFLRNYITNILPESDIGKELTYRLKERHALVFVKLLADLENAFLELKINGCTVSEPIVEDIFLCMGAEDPSKDDHNRHSDIMNGLSIYVEEYKKLSFVKKHKSHSGLHLMRNHLYTILLKHFTCDKRKVISLLQYVVPIVLTLLTYIMRDTHCERPALVPRTFLFSNYPDAIAIMSEPRKSSELQRELVETFKQNLKDLNSRGLGHKLELTGNYTMEEFLLMKQLSDPDFDRKYMRGFSFTKDYIVAWYNSFVPHTAPLSLNMLHNDILLSRSYKGQITVKIEPQPFQFRHGEPLALSVKDLEINYNFHHFLAFNLTYTICFSYAFILMYLVHERMTRFKLLQFICGVRHLTFILGGMLYDFFKITFISFTVFLTIIICEHSSRDHIACAGFYLLILSLFGVCVIPFYYLVSVIFHDAETGYIIVSTFTIYGVATFSTLGRWEKEKETPLSLDETLAKMLWWIGCIFPHFSLCSALIKIQRIKYTHELCASEEHKVLSKLVDECVTKPSCCAEPHGLDWSEDGVFGDIVYFFIYGLLCTILLFLFEFRTYIIGFFGFTVPKFNVNLAKDEYERSHTNAEMIEDDILLERMRVQNLPRDEYKYKPLVTSNIAKIYGDKVAVHQLSLVMEKQECLGILGANGSGKSTLLKMLVGDEKPTCGRAYVEGINMIDDLYHMYEHIGYCPHIDAVPDYMTCREMLVFFCRLRGIPSEYIKEICLCLVKVLGIMSHYNKQIYFISPGIKRRLSTAISMIGSPSLIYLDEHTSGIDPAGRRQIWNITGKMCKHGTAFMITTQNTYECERFCTRLGFIHNGRMLCLDTVYSLQKRFVKGYLLQVKVKVVIRPPSFLESGVSLLSLTENPLWNPFFKVMAFVEEEFPNATVSDHRGAIITYLIPAADTSISQIYRKLHRNAFILNIESFSVIHESLSLIFTDIAERNKFVSYTSIALVS